jgi:hypothetical protein
MSPDDLRAEISRLRALCERHDIDPDEPEPAPYKEPYGPPTELQWLTRHYFAKALYRQAVWSNPIPQIMVTPISANSPSDPSRPP